MSELSDAVREANKTELSRLGSSKALYALTEGEMEDDVVLARAADLFQYSADAFDDWDGDVATAAAATAADAADDVAAELGDYEPGDEPAVAVALAEADDASARLGALAGWALVVGTTVGQLTGYFVGQADPQTAQTFRDLGEDVDALREQALDAVDEDDRDAAEAAANAVVEAAYDEYFETLEELGVNPKPVC